MTSDVGPYLRLQSAIQASIAATPDRNIAASADAMSAAYKKFRAEAFLLADDSLRIELDRLFPDDSPGPTYGDLLQQASTATTARTRLAGLAGWIDGIVQSMKFKAETDALARERARAESDRFHS